MKILMKAVFVVLPFVVENYAEVEYVRPSPSVIRVPAVALRFGLYFEKGLEIGDESKEGSADTKQDLKTFA